MGFPGQANPANLKPFGRGHRSREEELAINAKGGRADGERRRKQKFLRDVAKELSTVALTKKRRTERVKELMEMFGIKDDVNVDVAMLLSMYHKAINGDVEAAKFIRDTRGEGPAQMIQIGPIDAVHDDLSQLTDEQLEQQLLALSDGFDNVTTDSDSSGDSVVAAADIQEIAGKTS